MKDIVDAKIIYKGASSAIFNLGTGESEIKSSGKNIIKLNFKGFESVKESDWKYIMLPKDEKVTFEARVSMDKPMDGVDLGKIKTTIPVTENTRQTIKISQQLCGALINNGDWKQFMCYDLGAYKDEGYFYPVVNPFKPKKRSEIEAKHLHGPKYQWGYPNNGTQKLSTLDDYVERGIKPDYSIIYNTSDSWNNHETPCTDGYRLPTRKELETLASFNFTKQNLEDNAWNYEGGYVLDPEKGSLFIPATGDRRGWGSTLYRARYRGIDANLWSSDSTSDGKSAYALRMFPDKKSVTSFKKDGWYLSIRCVKN